MVGEREDLGAVPPDDGGAELEQREASLHPESGGGGGDGVEHPGAAGGGGGAHGGEPVLGERADVYVHCVAARGEVGHLAEGVDHGRGGARGEEGVGSDVHGDEIGDALHQRCPRADGGEEGPRAKAPPRWAPVLGSGGGVHGGLPAGGGALPVRVGWRRRGEEPLPFHLYFSLSGGCGRQKQGYARSTRQGLRHGS